MGLKEGGSLIRLLGKGHACNYTENSLEGAGVIGQPIGRPALVLVRDLIPETGEVGVERCLQIQGLPRRLPF